MIEKLQTFLLVLILVAVVWIGYDQQRQPRQIGRYAVVQETTDKYCILDTATGELHRFELLENVATMVDLNLIQRTLKAHAVSTQIDPQLVQERQANSQQK